nr:MAG TPA: E2 glycoprotein [Caudoviricetes sp.]
MIITKDLIKYPDQFSSILNDLFRRVDELENEVKALKERK